MDVLIGLVILEGLDIYRYRYKYVDVDIVSAADLLVLVTLLLVLPALLLVGCLAFVLPESGGGSG